MVRYVTRWALSTGIRQVDGKYTDDGKYFFAGAIFVTAAEAHESMAKAFAQARKMAAHKVESLRKQVAAFSDPKWSPKVVGQDGKPLAVHDVPQERSRR